MPRHRLRLEVPSANDLPAAVAAQFGPEAEIVAAERVTVGGFRGFLAKQHFEVTLVVPDAPRAGGHVFDSNARAGIEALLADADDSEARFHRTAAPHAGTGSTAPLFGGAHSGSAPFGAVPPGAVPPGAAPSGAVVPAPPPPTVSTGSAAFDDLMASLAFTVRAPITPRRPAPAWMARPGDLVVIVGLDEDSVRVARQVAAELAACVAFSDGLGPEGVVRVEDRRTAMETRSAGVLTGTGTVVAARWSPHGRDEERFARTMRGMAADQVWVAVDARRKSEDTALWVARLQAIVPVAGLAVLGREGTATPESVEDLGLPTGWVEDPSVG